jgi:hypothetical protein
MSTEQNETEEDLIPVETPPEQDASDDDADDSNDGGDEGDDDDADDGDSRLAESEEDSENEVVTGRSKRRRKRRDLLLRAKEEDKRKIELLEKQTEELLRRLASVEGHAMQTNAQTLEERLAKAQRDVQQAEHFIAKATEAGNGEDVVAAMRIRDQAIAETNQLTHQRQQFEQARQQAAQPQVDPTVVNYAKEWMQANPWYDPQARDRDSALTKAIDNELVREGYNPASREYWEELTDRVAEALGEDAAPAPRRKKRGPPTGNTREHAPVSTKREIYVTPERKQAMIEAGAWDDPVLRQRLLKAYQSYDAGSAR